jgi:hypothetical protein
MPAVLTAAATLVCPHQGQLLIQPSQNRLAVDGQPVLLTADLLTATILGCTNTPAPCLSVTSVLAGFATTLQVGAAPVALATAQGLTNIAAPWRVSSAGQTKLEAA